MTCPRCNTEWDVSKSPCPRCGLRVHLPGRSGTRPNTPSERAVAPSQTPRVTQTSQTNDGSFTRQQSGGMPPINPRPADGSTSARPQAQNGQQSSRMPSGRPENRAFPPQPGNSQMPTTPYPSRIPPQIQRVEPQREMMQQSQPSLPAQPQRNNAETPSSPMNTLSHQPRPVNTSSPNHQNAPFFARSGKDDAHDPGNAIVPTSDKVGGGSAATHNVPQRPQIQAPFNRSTENLSPDAQRSMRPGRLVTDALAKEGQRRPNTPTPLSSRPGSTVPKSGSQAELSPLIPGTVLRGGRYRLQELQGRQDWLEGVFEATWIAQDAQRSGSQVMIRELVTPDSKSMVMQSTLRNATMALTSVGRHAHIPTLWDAFSDQERNFFVFEPTEGESLATRMRRTRRVLSEQEVIACCLQMTEILEILIQQSPSLVHGLIQPEHIIIGRTGSDYILTNFSIILAGGATQYITGIDRSHLTAYTAPEFVRGTIDGRSDLYSLLATAYHAVTGSLPVNEGIGILQAQRLNPNVSAAFDAILARGLRPIVSQRYQRPSELRQELLAMRSVNSTVAASTLSHVEPDMAKAERPVSIQTAPITPSTPSGSTPSTILPSMMSSSLFAEQEQRLLLPRPEELPAMQTRNDSRQAAFWLIGILICLIIIVIVSRGFM